MVLQWICSVASLRFCSGETRFSSQGKVPNSDSSILTTTASKNHKKYVDKDSIKNFSDRLQVDEKSTFKVVNYAKNGVFFEIRGHQKHLYLTSFAVISTFSTVFGHGEHFLSVFRKSWKFWKKLIFWTPMDRPQKINFSKIFNFF